MAGTQQMLAEYVNFSFLCVHNDCEIIIYMKRLL